MFYVSNFSTISKCCNNSSKLVIGKMKDETGCVTIVKFLRLKPKVYSFLVDNSAQLS